MRPWVLWMIHHRMAWLLRILAVILYPVHLLAYWPEALEDTSYAIDWINQEEKRWKHE